VIKGGLGSAVLEYMSDHNYTPKVRRIGLPDKFIEHGKVKELREITGMDAESIYKTLIEI
jgi:1-deoxy-D-xylulose-5-phosphate synthase